MNHNIKLTVPFFIVRDMKVSLAFYIDKLDFTMTNQWTPRGVIEWCRLERDAVSVMLQEPRKWNADQSAPLAIGLTITYQCVDALALYHEFRKKGIILREPFVGNGLWVVGVVDPDGYRLEFASPTDVPEETTYSNWEKSVSIGDNRPHVQKPTI